MLGCVIGLPLLVLGMLLLLETFNPEFRPVKADIRFIGYTNTVWGHIAQMRVQNTSDFPIILAGGFSRLESKSSADWKTSPISIRLPGNLLQPGQSEVIEFATPVLTNTWKIEVGYYEHESKVMRTYEAVLRKIGLQQATLVWMVESEIVTP